MSHYIKQTLFILKKLHSCSYVSVKVDSVKRSLQPPYKIVRPNECLFKIRRGGQDVNINTALLKPAFLSKEEGSKGTSSDTVSPLR